MKYSPGIHKMLLLSFFIITLLVQCKKDPIDKKEEIPLNEIVAKQNERLSRVITSVTEVPFLHGYVFDENGNPLSGVEVKAGGNSQTTNKDGYFILGEIALNKDFTIVRAEKSGYVKGFRTLTPTVGAMHKVEIRLQSRGTAQNIEAGNGGELTFDGGKVKLNFPAGSIADADGKAYSGTVKVYARYINPETEDFASMMPGNLIGLTDNNQLSGMVSFGMANVELVDNNGKPLQILKDKTVRVTLPAIKDGKTDLPIWHFNETYGLWVEAGKSTKTGTSYSFEANHFSTWHLGYYLEDGIEKVTIALKSSTNQALGSQRVGIYTSDFTNRLRTVFTDNNGQFKLLYAPKNLGLRIETTCQNIDRTVSINTENVTVTFNNLTGNAKVYYLSGTVKDCSDNYANSYFTLNGLTENKISFSGKTNTEGKFETNVILCDMNTSTVYPVQVMVFTSNNTVKLDTIELTFNNTSIEKNIDFCASTEVENPYLNPDLTYGSVTDIDGNKYATIQIGTQTWMAENLRTSRYNDGTVMPNVSDSASWRNLTTSAWTYAQNDISTNKYWGKQYNWYAVREGKLCPQGWKIPDNADWTILTNYLGGDTLAFRKLISQTDWNAIGGTKNQSGFSALQTYVRMDSGGDAVSPVAVWWSSTIVQNSQTVWTRLLQETMVNVITFNYSYRMGLSCRCIKE